MSIQVVTVLDKEPSLDYLIRGWRGLNESLARFKVKPTVLGYGQKWSGLGSKAKLLKKAIESGAITSDRVLFVDSHDVVFTKSPSKVDEIYMSTYEALYDIVMNAERWIFPDPDLGPYHPKSDYPYRYLNSGIMIGKTASIFDMLEQMQVDAWVDDYQNSDGSWTHINDQLDFQKKFLFGQVADNEPDIGLDDCCLMFQTLTGESLENFDFSKPKTPKNIITGTSPMVWHGNGPAKNEPVWNTLLQKLKL